MFDALWGGVSDLLGDSFSSLIESILNATIFKLAYYIETGLCRIINILQQLFGVFAGLERVKSGDNYDYLVNVFFSNKAISNIYWAMAVMALALTIGFTIWAVVKKMFDASDKEQRSFGQILTGALRSMILILGLTLVMGVVINATNVLMQQIDFIFKDPYQLDQEDEKEFTAEEYAAMGRILATIGNYSMISTRNNRYNLNMCFNQIRPYMYFLQQQGVFDYSYHETKDGVAQESWQSVLAQIAASGSLTKDISVDQYHEGIANSILHAMDYLQNNKTTTALQSIKKTYTSDEELHMDRMIFLMGTLGAARNAAYNEAPALDDALRGP